MVRKGWLNGDRFIHQQVAIEPKEDVTGFRKIGEEITEELEYTPGKFFVRQFIRPKYARPSAEEGQPGVVIGDMPDRIIDKGIAVPGLLASLMVDKYVDHLPLFRQNERFNLHYAIEVSDKV